MKQYSITHYEKAIETMIDHYKEKNHDVNENLIDIKIEYDNLFYNMNWEDDRFEVAQIDSKQAWVITDTRTGNKYLQSYNTIVSIYFADTKEVLRLGKWSRTTSKHQTFFERYVY